MKMDGMEPHTFFCVLLARQQDERWADVSRQILFFSFGNSKSDLNDSGEAEKRSTPRIDEEIPVLLSRRRREQRSVG